MAARASSLLLALALVTVGPAPLSAQPASGPAAASSNLDDDPIVDVRTIDHESYRAIAARLPEGQAPRIDGKLDDAIWATAPLQGNFIQREPRFGAPASEKTEFRILYDDRNIYIAVWAWDSDPEGILGSELKRDSGLRKGDQIKINFDTFHDHRNAFYFSTNPLGAYKDANSVENGRTINYDWNAVWNNKTSVDDKGWYVETRHPAQPAAFPHDHRRGALGLQRLPHHPPQERRGLLGPVPARVGRRRASPGCPDAGVLSGLNDLRARRRIEFVPYVLPTAARDYVTQGAVATRREVRRRLQDRADQRSHRRPHLSHRLRAGGGGPGGGEPLAFQPVLPGEAAVLHRERRHLRLRQVRVRAGRRRGGRRSRACWRSSTAAASGWPTGRRCRFMAGGRVTGRVGQYALGALNVEHRGRDHSTRRHPDDAERR